MLETPKTLSTKSPAPIPKKDTFAYIYVTDKGAGLRLISAS